MTYIGRSDGFLFLFHFTCVCARGFLLGLDENTTRHCIREHVQRIVNKAGNLRKKIFLEIFLVLGHCEINVRSMRLDSRRFGKTWVAFIPEAKEEAAVGEKEKSGCVVKT